MRFTLSYSKIHYAGMKLETNKSDETGISRDASKRCPTLGLLGREPKGGTPEFLSNPGVILGCVSRCGNELVGKSPSVVRPCFFDNPFCELNLDLGRNLCDT